MHYSPFLSDVELAFYTNLASEKINHDKLNDAARKLTGFYEIKASDPPEVSCRMQVHGNSLTKDEPPSGGYYRAEGVIKNFNTIEEYRNADKNQFLRQSGSVVWDAIQDGTIYSCPSLLASFVVLSFADLKRYRFMHWFGFPAIHSVPTWSPVVSDSGSGSGSGSGESDNNNLNQASLSHKDSITLSAAVAQWRSSIDSRQHGFFLARKNASLQADPVQVDPQELEGTWTIAPLSDFENGFLDACPPRLGFICFADPSNYENAPGWMLRNLLILVRHRWKLDEVQILRYMEGNTRQDQCRSLVLRLKSEAPDKALPACSSEMPKVTGWERNNTGKLTGRTVDLKDHMDPKRLADQSVDLNLKLMKWRISPDLHLDKIKGTKCLLLGAGTLGSYVSRNLLGWGVRHITFVDNGKVSFSNPVRQPLFNFNDCLGGGTHKAHCAAEALKKIYPGVETSGHSITIPMLGHPFTDPEKSRKDFEAFKELVDDHDAVFILMDTREARWLPTILGKAAGKIVMNAALGFDTYVAMRHGGRPVGDASTLGCYFCNDVVAPADSVKDQTLDQQCTVTRPGGAAIASALLVELFVSILQHPDGVYAPTGETSDRDAEDGREHPLGIVPHQIRGFLRTFSSMSAEAKSYDCCSACSETVLQTYERDGWKFVEKALNERDYVEELSGLKEVHRRAEEAAATMIWEDDDDDDDDDAGEIIDDNENEGEAL